MIWPILVARTEIEKCFHSFLVQMKTSKFAFEINWPLAQNMKKNLNIDHNQHNRGQLTLLFVLGSEDKPGMLLSKLI